MLLEMIKLIGFPGGSLLGVLLYQGNNKEGNQLLLMRFFISLFENSRESYQPLFDTTNA